MTDHLGCDRRAEDGNGQLATRRPGALLRRGHLFLRRHAPFLHLGASLGGLIALGLLCLPPLLTKILVCQRQILPHSEYFLYPDKPGRLWAYVALAAAAFLLVLGGLLVRRRPGTARLITSLAVSGRLDLDVGLAAWGLSCVALPWFVVSFNGCPRGYSIQGLLCVWWATHALWTFRVWLRAGAAWLCRPVPALFLTGLAVLWSFWIFLPLCLGPPRLINEFLAIPTQTRLASGRVVDSLDYAAVNRVYGVHPPYDFRRAPGRDPLLAADLTVPVDPTPNLLRLLSGGQPLPIFCKSLGAAAAATAPTLKERIEAVDRRMAVFPAYYRHDAGLLVASGPISEEDCEQLCDVARPKDEEAIRALALKTRTAFFPWCSIESDPECLDFLARNQFEHKWQVLDRYMLHHHNFVLGSINEQALGRPVKAINFQYGRWATTALGWILSWSGGVTMQAYHSLLHGLHLVYLLAGIALAWVMLRDRVLVAAFALASVAIPGMVGHEFLVLAPGLNPFRHLFDLATLTCAVLSWRSVGGRRGLWSLLAYGCAFLGVASNPTTGGPLFAALSLAMLLDDLGRGRRLVVSFAWRGLLLGLAFLLALAARGTDRLTPLYLQGFLGFPEMQGLTAALLLGTCGIYLGLIRCWRTWPRDLSLLLLMGAIYAQGLFLYYVWGGSRYHLFNYGTIYVLVILIVIRLLRSRLALIDFRPAALVLTSILFLVGAGQWIWTNLEVGGVFSSHVVHDWSNPRARIRTTMPEIPFTDSVDLIRRHAGGPGIAIISRFDTVLPFLADTYSDMLVPDLQWFINTPEDRHRIIADLQARLPATLFVDTDIDRHRNYDISPTDWREPRNCSESILRFHRLTQLAVIFEAVRSRYALVETGPLISVWRRTDPSSDHP